MRGRGGARLRRGPSGWRWLLVALWVGIILLFSSIPDVGRRVPEALDVPGLYVLGHAVGYGVFGALVAFASGRWWPAMVMASGLGAVDELYQGTVPGRTSSVLDWLVDTCSGAIGGASTIALARRRGTKRRAPGGGRSRGPRDSG